MTSPSDPSLYRFMKGDRYVDKVLCNRHAKLIELRPGWGMGRGEPVSEPCCKCDEAKREKLDGVYYNTTAYDGEELTRRIEAAANQDVAILLWLQHHRGSFTRDELHDRVLPRAQNTSIGRSLNTLMRLGYIDKLHEKRAGKRDHQQHLWRIRKNVQPTEAQPSPAH